MAGTAVHPQRPRQPQPAWDIARIYPDQGCWEESDYLELDTNHLIEFSDGFVDVLPMPTQSHQLIVQFLSNALFAFAAAGRFGRILFAPLRVRLRKGRYREPDVVFMLAAHKARMREKYWEGADLVMEVVSDDPESRERDLVTKRTEYAAAGISEYWIIDPQERRVTALALQGKRYAVHGEFRPGQRADSKLLDGFNVSVSEVLAAGK
jgi:Uma2 family endonuclease